MHIFQNKSFSFRRVLLRIEKPSKQDLVAWYCLESLIVAGYMEGSNLWGYCDPSFGYLAPKQLSYPSYEDSIKASVVGHWYLTTEATHSQSRLSLANTTLNYLISVEYYANRYFWKNVSYWNDIKATSTFFTTAKTSARNNYLTERRSSSSEVFLEKGALKLFTGEHLCQTVILIKLLCYFIEIALRHRSSPVNLLHIFRTPLSKNTSGGCFCEEIKKYWHWHL